MKKRILTLLIPILAIFASCQPTNPPSIDELEPGEYRGAYTVKKNNELTFEKKNVMFHLNLNDSHDQITLTMNQVKFATMMPVTLTIVAADLPCEAKNGVTTAFVESVVPTVGDVPMEKYTLYKLSIETEGDKLAVSFDCKENTVEYLGTGLSPE